MNRYGYIYHAGMNSIPGSEYMVEIHIVDRDMRSVERIYGWFSTLASAKQFLEMNNACLFYLDPLIVEELNPIPALPE